MQTPNREIMALAQAIAQIRLWSEMHAENASRRQPDHIGDELLNACEEIASGLDTLNIPNHDLGFGLRLSAATHHVSNARLRVIVAGIARIHNDAHALRDEVGHDILQKCFRQYDELFTLLGDAVKMAERANHPPQNQNREKLFAWAAEQHSALFELHKRMLACKTAAVATKSRERRNIWLPILATTLAAALIAIVAALLSL